MVDPRCPDDYVAHGGFKGLHRALSLGPQVAIEEIVQSGLRGRGGAGFPTGIKWRTSERPGGWRNPPWRRQIDTARQDITQ